MKHFNVGLHVKGKERYLLGNRAREYMHGDKIAIAVLCNYLYATLCYAMLRYAISSDLLYFCVTVISTDYFIVNPQSTALVSSSSYMPLLPLRHRS